MTYEELLDKIRSGDASAAVVGGGDGGDAQDLAEVEPGEQV